jgi:hypothetical protein
MIGAQRILMRTEHYAYQERSPMAAINLYLSEEEADYVRSHERGFVRGLVQWSMEKAEEKTAKEEARREALSEPFMEEA